MYKSRIIMTGFAFFVNVNTFSIVVNSMDPGDFDAYCAAFRSTKTIVVVL